MNGRPTVLEARDLSLAAGGRTLVERTSFDVKEGELCLLLGASGTGKSLALSLFAGLLPAGGELRASGTVRVLGIEVVGRESASGVPGTGVVFQDFALLDDTNALGNVRFGLDHRADHPPDAEAAAQELLDQFGLPAKLLPSQLSGGMKQRLALARVLAFRPKLVFYDEPTSGLDPAMKRQVAERIAEVHARYGMTSIVVTHDLPSLLGIADRVILLDPVRRAFRDVPRAEADATMDALRDFRAPDDTGTPPRREFAAHVVAFCESTTDFLRASLESLVALIPRFPSPRWGRLFLWRYLRLVAFGSALPFIGLAGLICGFVTSFFMFSLLPVKEFTEPVLEEEFIGSLGFALYRVVIPGVTTLLFATRSGAAIAADIGNRVLTRQIDAFRSHCIPPARYLLTGITLASLIGIPVLFVVADQLARLSAVAVFLAVHPGHGAYAFNAEFHRLLGAGGLFPGGTAYVVSKLLISSFGAAAIAYHIGIRPKPSGTSVAEGVTSAIIRATLFVLLVHMIFAFFEF